MDFPLGTKTDREQRYPTVERRTKERLQTPGNVSTTSLQMPSHLQRGPYQAIGNMLVQSMPLLIASIMQGQPSKNVETMASMKSDNKDQARLKQTIGEALMGAGLGG